jgi:NAD(P)H-flavin reductase
MPAVADDPMLPQTCRVRRRWRETADTFTLELEPADGRAERPFLPGQFNMVYVFGVGEVPVSISGGGAKPGALVHTTRAVGAVTRAMGRLGPGDAVGVRGPFGSHWPVEEARGNDVLLVAGGIGLAPLRPALDRLLAAREQYGRIVLLYGTRTPADILYRRQLQRWRAQFDLEVNVTVDRAMPGWRGKVGVVTTLIPRAPLDPLNTVAMVCGPEVMMRYVALDIQKRGVAPEHIYLSMERNMKCGIGLCGHCQYGPSFVCRDGPVFTYVRIKDLLTRWEI